MLATLRDLVAHKGHANAALLTAIRRNDAAAADRELRDLLAPHPARQPFWVLAVLGAPVRLEEEVRPSRVVRRARRPLRQHAGPLAGALAGGGDERRSRAVLVRRADSERHVFRVAGTPPGLPALTRPSGAVREAAPRHGGAPPPADFVPWLATRPRADWDGRQPSRRMSEGRQPSLNTWAGSMLRCTPGRQPAGEQADGG